MKVLGFDVGGSAIKAAPVDLASGALLAERVRLTTEHPWTPDTAIARVQEAIAHFNWQGPLGCGFPAAMRNGTALTAANIDAGWIGVDVSKLLQETTGHQAAVINDADAAGLAEMRFGAGREQQGTVIMVTVGTGLGTALFSDGRLFPNCELGHLLLNGKEAEQYASDQARKRKGLTWRKWAERFDRYLLHLERLFWPDLFIIGGGASRKSEKFFPHLTVKTRVEAARMLNDAGIVGAALAVEGSSTEA